MSRCFILTGAGSLVDAGLPGAYELTGRLEAYLSERWDEQSLHAYRYVCGGLLKGKGSRSESPLNTLNVEEVFAAVSMLAKREILEIAPFVGSWDAGVELVEAHRHSLPMKATKDYLDSMREYVKEVINEPHMGVTQYPMCERLVDLVALATAPAKGVAYENTAALMLEGLKTTLALDNTESLGYLEPMMQLAASPDCLGIATLNYDVGIETAASLFGQSVETGVVGWSDTGALQFPHGATALLKLHGSLSWRWDTVTSREGSTFFFRNDRIFEYSLTIDPPLYPVLVFGHGLKTSHEGPFPDLMWEFRQRLRSVDALLVIGYSFRDEHINQYIGQWFDGSSDRRIVVVGPEFDTQANGFLRQLAEHVPNRVISVVGRARDVLPHAVERMLHP